MKDIILHFGKFDEFEKNESQIIRTINGVYFYGELEDTLGGNTITCDNQTLNQILSLYRNIVDVKVFDHNTNKYYDCKLYYWCIKSDNIKISRGFVVLSDDEISNSYAKYYYDKKSSMLWVTNYNENIGSWG